MFLKRWTFLVFFLLPLCLSSQEVTKSVSFNWTNQNELSQGKLNGLENQFFTKVIRIRLDKYSKINSIILSNAQYESAVVPDLGSDLPQQIKHKLVARKGVNYLVVEVFPYDIGASRRLVSCDLVINVAPEAQRPSAQKSSITTSSFNSGRWFKIGVTANGIYKIDRQFIESMGVDPSSFDPRTLNVYGNATPNLSHNNADWRPDDIPLIPIYAVGETDGVFDNNDYFLFYAVGKQYVERESDGTIAPQSGLYGRKNYYFIQLDVSKSGSRMSLKDESGLTSNVNVTSLDGFRFYELDSVNLVKSGSEWYGEKFDLTLSRNFGFNLTELDATQNISLRTQFAVATNGGSNSLSISSNGGTLGTLSLPSSSVSTYTKGIVSVGNYSYLSSSSSVNIGITFNRTVPSSVVYLDEIRINYRRRPRYASDQFLVSDRTSVGTGNVAAFNLANAPSNALVFDVTNPREVSLVFTSGSSTISFNAAMDSLRSFWTGTSTSAYSPSFESSIGNQNLHGLSQPDYIMVYNPALKSQALRLADLHREVYGYDVLTVTTNQIFNEFSSGLPDPCGIRGFARMFYDRANGDSANMPRFLCLFGDGTYDPLNRLPNNNNMVPTYQNENSLNLVDSYTSDDFFGILDTNESMTGYDMMDIAVGRINVSDVQGAREVVNKIEHYMKNGSNLYAGTNIECGEDGYASTYGDWRNTVTWVADDENGGAFVNGAEVMVDSVKRNQTYLNKSKIYLDAYTQVTTTGGARYPEAQADITKHMEVGNLVINYIGHGGELGLAQERVVDIPQILSWTNINTLPLFVSATCEFTRFDDPSRISAGEYTFYNPVGGAVALLTTTRLVYISINQDLNENFYESVFERDANGVPWTFGEIMMNTKNLSVGFSQNYRNFMLIGDPGLRIALPEKVAKLDSINGIEITGAIDTLKALSKVRISGHLEDNLGNPNLTNGVAYVKVFDKPRDMATRGQDLASPVIDFQLQNNVIYKGRSTIENGMFTAEFIVPRDINLQDGFGKVSLYAVDDATDFTGYFDSVVVGGVDTTGLQDVDGPDVTLYLNDEEFVDGGITNSSPVLLINLLDESGINVVGNGIGHDAILIVDNDNSNQINLNEYYEAKLDTYQEGSIRYPLSDLSDGEHVLKVKIWDVNNNSSEAELTFVVASDENLALDHVLNYPNPFTTNTTFYFEHNQVCESLDVEITVMTVNGQVVKNIQTVVKTEGFRIEGVSWDGRDDYGDKIGRGTYIYRVKVTTPEGETIEKFERLVILK